MLAETIIHGGRENFSGFTYTDSALIKYTTRLDSTTHKVSLQ
jgi:hypothetical protein